MYMWMCVAFSLPPQGAANWPLLLLVPTSPPPKATPGEGATRHSPRPVAPAGPHTAPPGRANWPHPPPALPPGGTTGLGWAREWRANARWCGRGSRGGCSCMGRSVRRALLPCKLGLAAWPAHRRQLAGPPPTPPTGPSGPPTGSARLLMPTSPPPKATPGEGATRQLASPAADAPPANWPDPGRQLASPGRKRRGHPRASRDSQGKGANWPTEAWMPHPSRSKAPGAPANWRAGRLSGRLPANCQPACRATPRGSPSWLSSGGWRLLLRRTGTVGPKGRRANWPGLVCVGADWAGRQLAGHRRRGAPGARAPAARGGPLQPPGAAGPASGGCTTQI